MLGLIYSIFIHDCRVLTKLQHIRETDVETLLEEGAGIMLCKYLTAFKDFSKGYVPGLQMNEPFSRLCCAYR